MRFALLPLLSATLAAASPIGMGGPQHTTIVIEGGHSKNDTHFTNSTIVVPVGPQYRNHTALAAVSKLYIVNDDTITCIAYYAEIASGPHSHPFTFGHPAVMSKTPVTVGSIRCTGG
ncbi:hypothetical protein F5Y10DRAFT_262230 [Nemania abortiva]|nr:hypothetical protein F5Y10DRAFT_262230 [Nemania abortiva]